MSDEMKSVNDLAQAIRHINGWRAKGAGALAEELWPTYAALQQQLAAAREVVDHARLAEFHFSQWEDGQFPGEKAHSLKYLRGEMKALRAAIDATLQRDRQP